MPSPSSFTIYARSSRGPDVFCWDFKIEAGPKRKKMAKERNRYLHSAGEHPQHREINCPGLRSNLEHNKAAIHVDGGLALSMINPWSRRQVNLD